MIKKITLVFMSLLILILPIQQQRAQAIAPAVAIPLGIEVGAGAYVAGALAIAGIAGVMGYSENEEEIKEHATNVWNDANETVKSSVRASIEASVALGSSTIELSQEFIDWFQGTAIPYVSDNLMKPDSVLDNETIAMGYTISRSAESATVFAPSSKYFRVWDKTDNLVLESNKITVLASGVVSINTIGYSDSTVDPNAGIYSILYGAMDAWIRNHNVAQPMYAPYEITVSPGDIGIPIPNLPIDNYAEQVGQALEPVFNRAREKGISVPYADVVPTSGNLGLPLTWNPDSQVYKLPDGTIYDPAIDGAMDWSFPVPKVVTDEAGNVVTDTVTSIPKTEVITGEGVISDPITTTFDPTFPWVPPPPSGGGTFNPSNPIPVAMAIALFDLLVAIISYIGRLVEFILTIPSIPEIPIENYGFQWFKTAEIVGIRIYDVVMSMGLIGLSFLVFKAIRKVMP